MLTGLTADGISTAVISIRPGADGAQIGSMDGGRFILDGGGATISSNILLTNTTGTTVLIENIKIQNAVGGSGVRVTANGSATLRGIECIGQTAGFTAATVGTVNTATFLVERSRFIEIGSRSPVYLRYADADFTFRYVELHAVSSAAPLTGREAISLYGGLNGTITFDHVWIRQNGLPAGGTWMTAETRTQDGEPGLPTVNYRYCVFEHTAGSRALNVRSGTSNGVTLNIDHCDFIQNGTVTRETITVGTGSGRTITIKDTNFVNPNGTAAAGQATGDTYVVGIVNAATSATPAFVNMTPATELTVTPDYVNAAAGNFRYTSPSLLQAASDGRPMGSFYDFSNVLGPPVTALRTHWQIFE